jgi:hypothetical protein
MKSPDGSKIHFGVGSCGVGGGQNEPVGGGQNERVGAGVPVFNRLSGEWEAWLTPWSEGTNANDLTC